MQGFLVTGRVFYEFWDFQDVSFVADTANVLILAASEPNLSVRWRAAWSLSNLSDALLLNKYAVHLSRISIA